MARPALSSLPGHPAGWLLGLALVVPGCAPMAGPGTDWSLRGNLTQRIAGDINRDLDPDGNEGLLTNALDAGLVLDAQAKRALFSAELGVDAQYFVGEDDELAGTGEINPRASLSAAWLGKTTEISASGSFIVQEAETAEITDTVLSEGTTRQINVNAGFDLSEQIDGRNRISSGLDFRAIDFIDNDTSLIETRSVAANFGWQHVLTRTTTLDMELGLSHFRSDNAQGTRTQTASLSIGMSHDRTPRHTFRLNGGLTGLRSFERNVPGGTDLNLGFTGAAGMDYRTRSFTAGLDLTQSIEPSTVGELQAFTRLRGDLAYAINNTERLGLGVTLGRRGATAGEQDEDDLLTADISPRYTWRVAENTALTLSYAFRMSDDDDGTGLGHRVTLSVGQDFDFLP